MRRSAVITALVVLVLLVAAVAITVLTLGTKFGVQMGGQGLVTGSGTATRPFYGQVGWVRNTSPWPVEITSIEVDSTDIGKPVEYFFSASLATSQPAEGATSGWAAAPTVFPVTIPANSLRYLGFGLTPDAGRVGSFSTVTLHFTGTLPVPFTMSVSGIQLAASSPGLPLGLVSTDPSTDPRSLDGYLALLRSVIKSGDVVQLRNVMGPETTEEQAVAFKTSQKGFKFDMPVKVTTLTPDARSKSLQFYTKDPAKDGLKLIKLTWQDFRWTAAIG